MCWADRDTSPPATRSRWPTSAWARRDSANSAALLADPQIQIVAVCDPNTDSNDYVEWGKNSVRNRIRSYLGNPTWRESDTGCPGGREVGREVVDTYYANKRGAEKFKACAAYADFRELLEKEKDLDAVKIMTPDHLHATIAIAAMKKGKHVLVHKPIANRLYEGRLVIETARQDAGSPRTCWPTAAAAGNEMIARRIKEGVIGTLREIHNWTNRPVWPQYTEIPTDTPPVPKGFDWDLWLGPAAGSPLSSALHAHGLSRLVRLRRRLDGRHGHLQPVAGVHGAGTRRSAQRRGLGDPHLRDRRPRQPAHENDFSYPTACTLRFKFAAREPHARPGTVLVRRRHETAPARGTRKPRTSRWPARASCSSATRGRSWPAFNGQDPQLFAKGKREPLSVDSVGNGAKRAARINGPWLQAVKGGEPSPGNFLNAASITDAVNLGTVALRAGKKVLFDSENMKITNVADANKYLYREYRKGWEL